MNQVDWALYSMSYIGFGFLLHFIFSVVISKSKYNFNKMVSTVIYSLFIVIAILFVLGFQRNSMDLLKYNLGVMAAVVVTTLLAYVAIAQKMKEEDVENILPILENYHIPIVEDLSYIKFSINDLSQEYYIGTPENKWNNINEIKKSMLFRDEKETIDEI